LPAGFVPLQASGQECPLHINNSNTQPESGDEVQA
jgi:hypothetical protein